MNRLAVLILFLGTLSAARAQLDVSLEMKRNTFMRGEPIEATVVIRNLAGKDIMLRDENNHQWFGFEISKGDLPIGPFRGDYKNAPLVVLNGATVRRSIDLLKLYPVNEYGTYKVRAAIFFAETGKYISSDIARLDISDGRKLFSRTVGVPASKQGAGEYRVMTLLSFQQPKELTLYARVEDEATGNIYGTYPIGRLVGGTTPGTEFDSKNTLHVLHMVAPGNYYLSKIGVNGEWFGQTVWDSAKGRPTVRRKPDGSMVVLGATRKNAVPQGSGPPVPKLSDRPAGLPE